MNFNTIQEFNQYVRLDLPKSELIDIGQYPGNYLLCSTPVFPSFYRVSLKYGLEEDKNKGYMYFSSPNQAVEWSTNNPLSGYYIQITEAFLLQNPNLNFSFLNYGIHDPLILNSSDEYSISMLFKSLHTEFNKDNPSKALLVSYLNLIFTHISEIYNDQFSNQNNHYRALVDDFFNLLNNYYINISNQDLKLPNVNYFADQMNLTPNYISDVIKSITGKPALDHIHNSIIDRAKTLLSSQKLSVKETAYQLGFEYPTYFSRLFRNIVGTSPSKYRNP